MARVEEEITIDGLGLEKIDDTAKKIFELSRDNSIWLFNGDMGSGKTTLIKAICKIIGVEDRVTSPTFSIVNEYQFDSRPVYHFDFYRLKNLNEAIDIGIEDYFYSNSFCFIEWPLVIRKILPSQYLDINIEAEEGVERKYKLSYHGSY